MKNLCPVLFFFQVFFIASFTEIVNSEPSRLVYSQPMSHWRFWNMEDDLMTARLFSIACSPTGNLIINSNFNLLKFDGYRFGYMGEINHWGKAYEDQIGEIWTIAPGGIQKLMEGKWINYPLKSISDLHVPSKTARFIYQLPIIIPVHSKCVLYLAPKELIRFDPTSGEIVTLLESYRTKIDLFNHMIQAPNGNVWITGQLGVIKIEPTNEDFTPSSEWKEFPIREDLHVENLLRPTWCGSNEILCIAFSRQSQKQVLLHFCDSRWEQVDSPVDYNIQLGWKDKEERKWFFAGETVPSLYWMDSLQNLYNDRSDVLSGFMTDFASLPHGMFGFGTVDGLYLRIPTVWTTPSSANIDSVVHEVFEDNRGRIWFDCLNFLVVYDGKQWRHYPYPRNYSSHLVASSFIPFPDGRFAFFLQKYSQGKSHDISIDYNFSLSLFNPDTEQFEYIHHPENWKIRLISPKQEGVLWVQTFMEHPFDFRVETYDMKTGTFRPVPGMDLRNRWKGDYLFEIKEVKEGEIWFRGGQGIGVYSNQKYKMLGPEDGYPGGGGHSPIFLNEDETVWIGSENGINRYDGKKWEQLMPEFGAVRAIIKSRDGSIWVGSSNGIHRYRNGQWITNDDQDGLPSKSVYSLIEDRQGRIWVETARGIGLYQPEMDSDPPITFVSDKNLKSIAPDGNAQFVYSGIDRWKYTKADRLYYSYRIDQNDWSLYTTETVANYRNLSTGKHTFHVKAIDRNWNESVPVFWEFVVLLPWYQQPGFIAISFCGSFLTLAALAFALHRHLHLEKLVHHQTAELLTTHHHILHVSEHEQQRIGHELHDGVVQDLTGIALFAEFLARDLRGHQPGEAEAIGELVQLLDQSAQQVRRLARGLAPIDLEAMGLESALEQLARNTRQLHNVACVFECPATVAVPDNHLLLNLFRLAQEAVNNAAKHAQATRIVVRLEESNNQIVLVVEDNGRGLDPACLNGSGMGCHIMRYRAQAIGATLEILNRPGGGTRVVCTVEHFKLKDMTDSSACGKFSYPGVGTFLQKIREINDSSSLNE